MIPSIEEEIRDLHGLFGSPRDPEGRAFVPLADAFRRAGDPSRALEVLESGIERHPDLAAGHLVAGLAFRDLADDAEAERSFRRVLDLDGDNARALIGLGRILKTTGADEEGDLLIERGLTLDASLALRGAPARIPRHSANPEVVGNEESELESDSPSEELDRVEDPPLEAMEWEVIDVDSLAAPVEAAPVEEELVIDIADLSPDVEPAADPPIATAGQVEIEEVVGPEPFELTTDASEQDLDIDWGVPEPVPAAGAAVETEMEAEEDKIEELEVETLEPEADAEEFEDVEMLVVDADSLAPDDWDGAPAAPVTAPDGDLLMDLADLAPDIEPGSRHEEESEEEALPTRTLGELYARQGLRSEAVRVFESLVARNPGDVDLRARLDELRTLRDVPAGAQKAPVRETPAPVEVVEDDGPPVADFLSGLLSWTPAPESPGADD